MEYFLNSKGYPQADFRGRFMCFKDEQFKDVHIKHYSSKGFLKDMGIYSMDRAKFLFGEHFVSIVFVREGELVAILEVK